MLYSFSADRERRILTLATLRESHFSGTEITTSARLIPTPMMGTGMGRIILPIRSGAFYGLMKEASYSIGTFTVPHAVFWGETIAPTERPCW